MKSSEKIYYSIDIETSGFDPEKNEILEVGFLGFVIREKTIEIKEKWSRVFKPKGQVHPRIFGLTGISQKELDAGGKIQDQLFFLQGKLGRASLVGHNVSFDIKFLEKYGLKLTGPKIDTMDLVQFLLPTHHSYNLENLTHLFGIPHKQAHRALADARACAQLLYQSLALYQGLPEPTKQTIRQLAGQAGAPWAELFDIKILPDSLPVPKLSPPKKSANTGKSKFDLAGQTIYITQPFVQLPEMVRQVAERTTEPVLIVVPRRYQVLELWRQSLARGVFGPEQRFDAEKFRLLLTMSAPSLDLAKFLMKISVWQTTNWQKECLQDLNLSFAGGQHKPLIAGQDLPKFFAERALCCDQQTFLQLKNHPAFKNRALVMVGLIDFERAITSNLGQRSSWSYIGYLVKSIYDPQTGVGRAEHRDVISQLLVDVDLFFGLTNALLEKFNGGFGEVPFDDRLRNSFEFVKIAQSAGHFLQKLARANNQLVSSAIGDFCQKLQDFFTDPSPAEASAGAKAMADETAGRRTAYVKWISFGEHSCSFHSFPLDISGIARQHFANFPKVCFVQPQNHEVALNYFVKRLGLAEFIVQDWQKPVAGLVKKLAKAFKARPVCRLVYGGQKSLAGLLAEATLPAAAIMQSAAEIAELYQSQYQKLRQRGFLLAEQKSGGANKLFRNFAIHKRGLLLVSGNSLLHFLRGSEQIRPIDRLEVSTLFFSHIPTGRFDDPYSQALAKNFDNPESELFLPLNLNNFWVILKFFQTARLKEIYLFVAKKGFKYEALYIEYLKQFFRLK